MAISKKLKDLFEKERVPYEMLEHPAAFTAMEIAGAQHIPGRQMVKSVLVNADGKFYLSVLPAIHYLDLEKFKEILGAKTVQLAREEDMARLFPDFEVGAAPPFGQLVGVPVYVDKILDEDNDIVFNAGTHTDMVKIKFQDFKRLAKPHLADIGIHIQAVKG